MTAAAGSSEVLCVGRLYCDLIFTDIPRMPTLGTETFAGALGLHAGGGAYITAAWLSSLGTGSALAGYLPPPPFGEEMSREIARAGVALGFCQSAPGDAAPQLTVSMATDEDRAFLTHRVGPPAPIPTAEALRAAGIRHVHVGELTTLIERPEIVRVTRDAGATLSVDCGWDDDLKLSDIEGLLPQIDVFLPNAGEHARLSEMGAALDAPGLTVVKRGAEGASATVDGRIVSVSAPTVSVVDTTGAGDAFNAGFLTSWLAGAPVEACLRAGNAVGARAVTMRGGFATERTEPRAQAAAR